MALRTSPKIFYGWLIVVGCFALTLTQGETMLTFGIFLKSLQAEFGWTRALTSSAFSVFLLGFSASSIITGRLSDRYNARPVLLICAFLGGAGLSLAYLTQDINQLRAFMFISGLGSGGTMSVPVSVVQRWFKDRPKAGLALAIVTCGAGVGMLVYPPLTNYLILNHGWRNAFFVLGILMFLVTGVGAVMLRSSPDTASPAKRGNTEIKEPELTIKQILLNASFLRITLAISAGIFVFQSISSHLAAYATDVGISPTTAAYGLSLIGALSIPGRLIAGVTADRLSWRRVLAGALFGIGLALTFLLVLKGNLMLYSFVILFGLTHGLRATSQLGSLGELFGTKSLGMLIGITLALAQLVSIAAPYLCGYIFDTTGSYFIVFISLTVLILTAGFIILRMKKVPIEASLTSERLPM